MTLRARKADGRRVLVTVGSTKFVALTDVCLSSAVLQALVAKGFTQILVQHGAQHYTKKALPQVPGITVLLVDYLPTLAHEVAQSDLVIAHAGAGTTLELLKARKKWITVINPLLMDNHQAELADVMEEGSYALKAVPSEVASLIASRSFDEYMDADVTPWQTDTTKFSDFIDALCIDV